jgi:hypothetical protein
MISLAIRSKDFVESLRSAAKLTPRGSAGGGHFSFLPSRPGEPATLCVGWAGGEFVFDELLEPGLLPLAGVQSGVSAKLTAIVSESAMVALAETLSARGTLRIGLQDGRLRIANLTLDCEVIEDFEPLPVPVGATAVDWLRLERDFGAKAVERAGHAEVLADAEARLDESIEVAAAALAWLGVTEDQLRDLVDDVL